MAVQTNAYFDERLLELVSPKVGLIRSLTRINRGAGEPNPPVIYQALLSHFDFRRAQDVDRSGFGKGGTEAEAIGGAIGEAVERYCASQPDPGVISKASFAELGPGAIHPAEFVLFSETQYTRSNFPYQRFDEHVEMDWIRTREGCVRKVL